MSDVLFDVEAGVATVTLNRPEARNAITAELLGLLVEAMERADDDADIAAIVLTGADPAFCAGLDLDELSASGGGLLSHGSLRAGPADTARAHHHRDRGPFPWVSKPLIGAINGAAVTGGLELALNCDFLVASERARFGDTHARVGVMPRWGLTVLLPEAIGVRRAREMSFTGNFLDADEALRLGLVNHVVAHDDLLPFARALAADIRSNDRAAVGQLRETYYAIVHDADGWETEARDARVWQRTMFDPARVAARKAAITERGRQQ